MEALSLQVAAPATAGVPTSEFRDLFLSRSADDLSILRPIVARSWRRSRAAGVNAYLDRGYVEEGRVDEPTLRVAEPYLRKLDDVAADAGGYVSLTSPNGSLARPAFLRDDVHFPPGYSLLEASCGSNGEGLALEEGRGVWLSPEEHFREDMRGNWCFASLIRDPFHDRVRAVVGFTLPASEVRNVDPSSTLLMLEGVTTRIEREIENRMSSRERALLREYLRVSRRRSSAAVVATDGKHSYMNSVAISSFESGDLSIVRGYAKGVMSSGGRMSTEAMLIGPGPCSVEVTAVDLSTNGYGAVIVVRPHETPRERLAVARPLVSRAETSTSTDRGFERLAGTSIAFKQAVASAQSVIDHDRSAVIVGEPGSGKQSLASVIAAANENAIHLDAREPEVGQRLAEALRSASPERLSIVIAHTDELAPVEARDVAAQARSGRFSLILTATSVTEGTRAIGDASGALEIPLAPLRRRREDIPLIASAVAAEAGTRRLSRKVAAMITTSDWPGNITQLRQVVLDAADRAQGIEIGEDDLPEGFHRVLTGGRLSRLEDAELAEIRSALREAEGNRRLAAEALEIGRSTLYRRMDYFRSRGFDL